MNAIPFSIIDQCRICGSEQLLDSISLGNLASCGIFPKTADTSVAVGELTLKVCAECSLVQLDRNFDLDSLFGDEYGYRSSLNNSMRLHLEALIKDAITNLGEIQPVTSILDIGSNDGTLLNYVKTNYPEVKSLVGVDPTIASFTDEYLEGIIKIPDFFTAENLRRGNGSDRRFSLVTSVAMLYDLPEPNQFVKDIAAVLEDEGTWIFELTVLDTILENFAIDSICHEHLEYYSFRSIQRLLKQNDMAIWKWERNSSNGGSVRIYAKHAGSNGLKNVALSPEFPDSATLSPTDVVAALGKTLRHVDEQIVQAKSFLFNAKQQGKKVYGLGASTKGNAYLQYAQIGPELISEIAEVNEDKFDSWTPGTHIHIMDERILLDQSPDALFVFPWHFRDNFVNRYKDFLDKDGDLVFPLPNFEVVKR